MKKIFLLLCPFLLLLSCNESTTVNTTEENTTTATDTTQNTFGIIIHGGAGTILKENMTDSMETAYKEMLTKAIKTGHEILKNGGSSLEAVQRTINVMEDSPLFNSAKGAVFTNAGINELDASIMDGKTLNAGAVAGVTTVKNPINLAYEVMTNSDHVMLSGKGADKFAKERGLEIVDPSYFFTQKRYDALMEIKKRETIELDEDNKSAFYDPFIKDEKFGTVGCVALDKNGNKKYNRIGDSPIIGAGTYANNKTCGVSSTGWGEYFIRGIVAYDISAQMEYAGKTLEEAAKNVIQDKLTKMGGTGGIVAMDKDGNVAMEFNTAGMYRAHMDAGIYSK